MTDTPRTRDELLALFADNSTHEISAQDMRDLIVTTVAPPLRQRSFIFQRYNAGGHTTIPATTSGNTSENVALDIDPNATPSLYANMIDPAGWWNDSYTLDADDDASWLGYDIDGKILMLPPGVYVTDVFITTTSAIDVSTQWAIGTIAQATFDVDFDASPFFYPGNAGADEAWWFPGFYGPTNVYPPATPMPVFFAAHTERYATNAAKDQQWIINDSDEPQAYAAYAIQRSKATDTPIDYFQIIVTQISGEGW